MIKLDDKLYTSTEVASILGVSLRSVYRYIEEGKLTAEVKTATGRHRFTKQDILDFLYPDGPSEEPKRAPKEEPREVVEPKVVESAVEEPSEKEKEEDVDWLSKFRAAAEKFKKEDDTKEEIGLDVEEEEPEAEELVEIPEELKEEESSLSNDEPEVEEKSNLFYYRSSLGGLKDIAQNIDKSSKEASIDYAFTLNAGLSLHKPIKPFSLLHAYVRPGDLQYYEKLLSLSPSDTDNAQLCLITTEEDMIFSEKDSLHGLSVVSKVQLKKDIDSMAADLNAELDGVL